MTITTESLNALAPFAALAKKNKADDQADRATIDIGKVASTIVDETANAMSGDGDPNERIEALIKRVDAIDAMLSEAEYDEEKGVALLSKACEIAKEFEVESEEVVDDQGSDNEEGSDDSDEGSEIEKRDEDEDDLSDEIDWSRDLAPSRPPTMRQERLTKNEVVIPSRKRARTRMEKWQAARDRAMDRRAGGARSME